MSVIDPRALAIRSVDYCRHPDEVVIEPRITRQMFDGAGRPVVSWDPRLWGTAPQPNLTTVYGLSGQPVLTDSVDAGWQLSVLNHTGLLHSFWDARGNQRRCEYDDQQRSVAVTEQGLGALPCVVDRFTYGGADAVDAERNQCGRLIRHDNPASSQIIKEYGLAGAVLVESSSYLLELELPDWPLDPDARDEWLEDEVFTTRHSFRPTGEIERMTDAMGNARTFGYDVSGKLSEAWLTLAGEGKQPQRLVGDIRYNALDQIESETAGNGVKTQVFYGADDGRLIRLVAGVGTQNPLQDLNYTCDPVGNITEIKDEALAVTFFNKQRIEPINLYRYDAQNRLVEARGWEVSTPSHGPALPALLPMPLDPNQRRNYTQRFDYDAAGNLITRHHSGAPGFSMFTSTHSNRSLAQRDDGSLPGEPDIDSGFDAGGNQRELLRGQAMHWDARNQLSRVTLVRRKVGPNDYEDYAYDRSGHRVRKVNDSQTIHRTLRSEVRYLHGLEIHRQPDGEEHHVISTEAGRSSVRALHWPNGARADQLRYNLCDHLRSSTLELDEEAGALTREHYYPFGGTACWAGKSSLVAQYKTIRYSGKERDATGLCFYGYRYYAPWLQRWTSPDPAGSVNGLNIFCFVSNAPACTTDVDGRFYEGENDAFESTIPLGAVIVARGLSQLQPGQIAFVRAELLKVERIFSDAEDALKANFVENAQILQQYFGPAYETVISKVSDSWARGRKLAKEYQGPWGEDKFLIYIGNLKNQAHVDTTDFHGRVAVNANYINSDSLHSLLGHEILHVNRVNRFVSVGPGALDHFYLGRDDSLLLSRSSQQFTASEQGVSEVIMQGGLTVQYLDEFTQDHEDFISAVGEYFGKLNSGIDIDVAAYFFNRSPGLRARMASENADSLIFSAKSMSQLNQARLADSRLLQSLLSS